MSSSRQIKANLSLQETYAAFCEGRVTPEQWARALFNDKEIKNTVSYYARRLGIEHHLDDVHQIVTITCYEKITPGSINDESKLKSFIKSIIWKRCGNFFSLTKIEKRHERKTINSEDESLPDENWIEAFISDNFDLESGSVKIGHSFENDVIDDLDRSRAKAMLEQQLSFVGAPQQFDALLAPGAEPQPPKALRRPERAIKQANNGEAMKHKRKSPNNPEFQQIVLQIRDVAGISIDAIAEKIGTTSATLEYYTYSTRDNPPVELYSNARALASTLPVDKVYRTKELAKMSASDIVSAWMKKLGIDPESTEANSIFAKELGLDRTKVWRWKNNKVRPLLANIVDIDKQIDEKINGKIPNQFKLSF